MATPTSSQDDRRRPFIVVRLVSGQRHVKRAGRRSNPPELTRPDQVDETFHSSFFRTAVFASSPIRIVSPSTTTSGQAVHPGQSEILSIGCHLPSLRYSDRSPRGARSCPTSQECCARRRAGLQDRPLSAPAVRGDARTARTPSGGAPRYA